MGFVGVILAGGESRRFGKPKAFAKKDGKPFYLYSLEALEPYVSQLLIVTNPMLAPRFSSETLKAEVINDAAIYERQGPLAGIYSAMEKQVGEWYIVIPIDVPFIESNIIQLLMENVEPNIEAIIPVVSGKMQPLISIYHYTVKNKIKRNLDHHLRSVRDLLEVCKVKYVHIDDERPFVNINSQVDYKKFVGKPDI